MLEAVLNVMTDAMAQRYAEVNGITAVEVCRHHYGEPGYQVWELVGRGTGGYPEDVRTLRRARELGRALAAKLKVPYREDLPRRSRK